MSQAKKVKRAGPGGAGRSGFAKQKWTDEEEAALRAGVAKYGVGKWRLIQMDDAHGPVLANRSNVDLKDKWRNLNMDTSGARGDKRKKGRGRAPPAGAAVAAAAEAGAAAAAVPAMPRRKRKRRPERAPGAVSGSPPRPRPPPRSSSGGALRALQEAALGPDPDGDEEFSPRMAVPGGASTRPRRRTRRPVRVSEDELDEDDEEERARYEAAEEEEEEEDEEDEAGDLEVDDDDESGMDDGDDAAGYNGGSGGARRGPTCAPQPVTPSHYGGGAAFRRAVKLTLRRMVAAGRLENVTGRPGLFRLGGVVRHLTEGDSFGWPVASAPDPGPTLGDARTVVEAALAAARATAEAEEAAACATRLSEAADHYEREAEAEQKDAPDQGPPGD